MSLACSHMWVHVCHMSDTRYPHVSAWPDMCLTCENLASRVGKGVKLEQRMWATCEHMWATRGFNVIFPSGVGCPVCPLKCIDICLCCGYAVSMKTKLR